MKLRAYWWSPLRQPKTFQFEIRRNGRAWAELYARSGSTFSNYGDQFSPDILRYASGRPITWRPPSRADIYCVGSILQIAAMKAQAGALILGAGLRANSAEFTHDLGRLDIRLVRGTHTSKQLNNGDVPLGDPGLLVDQIYSVSAANRSGIGFVPHFTDFSHSRGRNLMGALKGHGVRIIYPTMSPTEVVAECNRCDLVLSSGLHGLVVADSLGVPALRVSGLTKAKDPEFKYQDYESVFGMESIPLETTLLEDLEHNLPTIQRKAGERRSQISPLIDDVKHTIATALTRALT